MLIPQRNLTILNLYWCPVCQKFYSAQTDQTKSQCLVVHAPGTCCHHTEKELSRPKVDQIMEIAEEA